VLCALPFRMALSGIIATGVSSTRPVPALSPGVSIVHMTGVAGNCLDRGGPVTDDDAGAAAACCGAAADLEEG